MQYLDCGCCMNDDGSRTWCPSCLSPPVDNRIAELLARLEAMTRLATSWQNKYEALVREMRTNERHSSDAVDLSNDDLENKNIYEF